MTAIAEDAAAQWHNVLHRTTTTAKNGKRQEKNVVHNLVFVVADSVPPQSDDVGEHPHVACVLRRMMMTRMLLLLRLAIDEAEGVVDEDEDENENRKIQRENNYLRTFTVERVLCMGYFLGDGTDGIDA